MEAINTLGVLGSLTPGVLLNSGQVALLVVGSTLAVVGVLVLLYKHRAERLRAIISNPTAFGAYVLYIGLSLLLVLLLEIVTGKSGIDLSALVVMLAAIPVAVYLIAVIVRRGRRLQ